MEHAVQFAYIIASALFVLALKWMNSPSTARRGVFAGEIGMLLAIVGTLINHGLINWEWLLAAFILGTAIGMPIAYLAPITAVPQQTALSHAFGALAAALVGTVEYYKNPAELHGFTMVALIFEMLLGYLTFTGSLMAAGKLQEILPTRPLTYKNQNLINLTILAATVGIGVRLIFVP